MTILNPCCWTNPGNLFSTRERSARKQVINFTPQYYSSTFPGALAALHALPIDGVLFDFLWTSPTFGLVATQKSWLYSDLIPYSALTSQIATIASQSMGNLKHNFLRMRLQPGVANTTEFWNDPVMVAAAATNMGTLARAARAVGCKGIMWDMEAYASDIQNRMLYYTALKAGFTLAERKVQVQAAMKIIAQALWENFPEAVVFMTFGYEEAYSSIYYDLIKAAVDGVLDALPGDKFVGGDDDNIPRVINGLEECYYGSTEAGFDYVFENKAFYRTLAAGETFHKDYVKAMSLSTGLWLERVDSAPWDTFANGATFDKNYYDPTLHRLGHNSWEELMKIAIKWSDMYVWLFSSGAAGFPGANLAYINATAAAIAASDMSRTRYNRRVLAVVSNAQRVAANTASSSIGMGSIFNIPLIDRGDAASTSAKYWMANLHISEAEYRGLKVVVGNSNTVTWSPQGNYNDSSVITRWLLGQGKRLAGSIENVGATSYLLLTSGDRLLLSTNSNILLAA